MCTDEQWLPKQPTKTVQTSKYWWQRVVDRVPIWQRKQHQGYWLTPLDVPKGEKEFFMRFPEYSSVCQTHFPAKLR